MTWNSAQVRDLLIDYLTEPEFAEAQALRDPAPPLGTEACLATMPSGETFFITVTQYRNWKQLAPAVERGFAVDPRWEKMHNRPLPEILGMVSKIRLPEIAGRVRFALDYHSGTIERTNSLTSLQVCFRLCDYWGNLTGWHRHQLMKDLDTLAQGTLKDWATLQEFPHSDGPTDRIWFWRKPTREPTT